MTLANKLRARIVQEHGYCLLKDEELVRIYARAGGRTDSTDEIERWFRGELRMDAAEAKAPDERTRAAARTEAKPDAGAADREAFERASLQMMSDAKGTARADAEPMRAPVPAKRDPVLEAYKASWRDQNVGASHANSAYLEGVKRESTERDLRSGGATFNDRAKAAYDASFRG